jgi:uncharacterized OB-fold protein
VTAFVPDVPAPDEITAPWWEATREHRLLVQGCTACGSTQHPPRAVCIGCGATDSLTWRPATGRGSVDTFTIVHRAPRPDLDVPYVIARVRLDEGVVLLTRLVGRDPDDWTIDDRVAVDWLDLPDGRALPVFVVASDPQT